MSIIFLILLVLTGCCFGFVIYGCIYLHGRSAIGLIIILDTILGVLFWLVLRVFLHFANVKEFVWLFG